MQWAFIQLRVLFWFFLNLCLLPLQCIIRVDSLTRVATPILSRVAAWIHLYLGFQVYPGGEEDARAYLPKWIRFILERIFPFYLIGIILGGKEGGFGLTISLFRDPQGYNVSDLLLVKRAEERLSAVFGDIPIGLAGRTPAEFAGRVREHPGMRIAFPLIDGVRGTVFTALECLRGALENLLGKNLSQEELTLFQKLALLQKEVTTGVVGVGSIGRPVMQILRGFGTVVAYDTRAREEYTRGNFRYTNNPKYLKDCNVIIILTPRGEDIENIIPFLKRGVMVLDDTHPEIPEFLVQRIEEEKQGEVWGIAVRKEGMMFWPKLLGFLAYALPGCAVEMFIESFLRRRRKQSVSQFTQNEFNELAIQLGFYAALYARGKNREGQS